jgi:hypothetical protein
VHSEKLGALLSISGLTFVVMAAHPGAKEEVP